MKIFLSVGATFGNRQEKFVKAFENYVTVNECEHFTVGRGGFYPSEQPVVAARNLMQTVDGVVVIAFTRQIIKKGFSDPTEKKESEISNRKLPTIWNQLEAAMAFGLKLPLLVIIERGLHQEAMLKDRHEYRALVTDLDESFFSSDEFKGIFADWKNKALNSKINTKKEQDVRELTARGILKELKPGEIWKVIVVIFTVASTIAIAAYWVGKSFPN